VTRATVAYGAVAPETLPACSIRDACRWYRQEGGVACGTCALVVTDQPPPGV
jgi:hypothetical protein